MIEFYECKASCYRCHASAWECVGDFTPHRGRVQDVLACAFCGVRIRVDAPYRRPVTQRPAEDGEFRFEYGRFKGLTIAEADAETNGRRYLETLRDSPATSERLRVRVTEYLNSIAAPSA